MPGMKTVESQPEHTVPDEVLFGLRGWGERDPDPTSVRGCTRKVSQTRLCMEEERERERETLLSPKLKPELYPEPNTV